MYCFPGQLYHGVNDAINEQCVLWIMDVHIHWPDQVPQRRVEEYPILQMVIADGPLPNFERVRVISQSPSLESINSAEDVFVRRKY